MNLHNQPAELPAQLRTIAAAAADLASDVLGEATTTRHPQTAWYLLGRFLAARALYTLAGAYVGEDHPWHKERLAPVLLALDNAIEATAAARAEGDHRASVAVRVLLVASERAGGVHDGVARGDQVARYFEAVAYDGDLLPPEPVRDNLAAVDKPADEPPAV